MMATRAVPGVAIGVAAYRRRQPRQLVPDLEVDVDDGDDLCDDEEGDGNLMDEIFPLEISGDGGNCDHGAVRFSTTTIERSPKTDRFVLGEEIVSSAAIDERLLLVSTNLSGKTRSTESGNTHLPSRDSLVLLQKKSGASQSQPVSSSHFDHSTSTIGYDESSSASSRRLSWSSEDCGDWPMVFQMSPPGISSTHPAAMTSTNEECGDETPLAMMNRGCEAVSGGEGEVPTTSMLYNEGEEEQSVAGDGGSNERKMKNGKRLSDYGIAAVGVDRIGDEERRVPSSAIAAQSAPSFTIYNQSFVDSVVPTSVNASDWTSANASTSWTSSSSRSAADLACDDYAGNIYAYMRHLECRHPICRGGNGDRPLLCRQQEVTSRHRFLVVDWLVELVRYYGFKLVSVELFMDFQETLHLAVSMLDRTLAQMRCPLRRLQLLAATALMVATKMEEYDALRVADVIDACAASVCEKPETIAAIERSVLVATGFRLQLPTAFAFANHFHLRIDSTPVMIELTNYLLELALLDDGFRRYRESHVAASAICAARAMLDIAHAQATSIYAMWTVELEIASGISPRELAACTSRLLAAVGGVAATYFAGGPGPVPFVFKKYCRDEHLNVAQIAVRASSMRPR